MRVAPAHGGIHHLLHGQQDGAIARGKAHVHAHGHEDLRHAGVLADRPMRLGAHAAVDQQLLDGVARRARRLGGKGALERLHEIDGMVVADVLQCVGNGVDDVFLEDHGHGEVGAATDSGWANQICLYIMTHPATRKQTRWLTALSPSVRLATAQP